MSEKPDRLYATTTGVLLGSKWVVWNTPTGPNDEIMSQETADLLNCIFADAEALRRDAERLTDEQIDSATSKERDQLLDHIYEYGTAAEGILERIRKLARAAIDAAMQKGDKT